MKTNWKLTLHNMGKSFISQLAEIFFFIVVVLYLGFTAWPDYFTHFEPSQSLGEAKTGDPQ